MIYLHKVLPLIASPLFLCLALILVGTIFRKHRINLVAILLLATASLPIVSQSLIQALEQDYELLTVDEVGEADAIVVLSGMVRTLNERKTLSYELTDAADRIFAGIELSKANKAPKIVLTGGKLPWSVGKPEGEFLRDVAIKNGILAEQIRITENVQNTDQEARATVKLLANENPKVILVTSAFHMPRARKVFEAAGLKVIPFAVDFRASADELTLMDFIPSANALKDTSFFVREMIGRLYYVIKY